MYSSHFEKDCPCVKKLQGEAGRIMFPEIIAELLLIRAINIHVKIADYIEVNMLFDRVATFHEVSFQLLTGKG